jgi:hypothetical protein
MDTPRAAPAVRSLIAAALLAGLVAGCAALGPREDADPFAETHAYVRVVNDNFYDVTVSLDWDGHRQRLGRVIGNRTEVFRFDAPVGVHVAFAVSVQAGRTFMTRRMTVQPGDEVEVRVPPDLDRR